MSPATFRLVLLVSCAHALVHILELSFGNVEQLICDDFGIGKQVAGNLGACLRLPYGLFSLAAGWLADRYGAKRLLLVYLFGGSFAAVTAFWSPSLSVLFVSMFTLGIFASIYHPAGVGLITHYTTPENRPKALGYHGIFGSMGIAAGPFIAGLAFACGASWREYFLMLSLPGVILGVCFVVWLPHETYHGKHIALKDRQNPTPLDLSEDEAHWYSYFLLLVVVALAGIVYAAILTFLPRYLDQSGLVVSGTSPESLRVYLTSIVLALGIIGQFSAGWLAKPKTLEKMMAMAFYGAAPCVLWMGFAQGATRILAAALFAPLFFMHQPLLNTLVAKYVPRRRRSLCYGFAFTCGFGIGAYGPRLAGRIQSEPLLFSILAAMMATAATIVVVLWWWNRPDRFEPDPLSEEEALL
ncbi:MAG: MFS transporter [Pirellulales bacterium]|nr:MFS transporter [Pirellulales bacterium]